MLSAIHATMLPLLQAVAAVAVPVVGTYVVKFLQARIGVHNTDVLIQDAAVVVRSIEQLYASGQLRGTAKYTEALKALQLLYPKMDPSILEHYIESQVHQLKVNNEQLSFSTQQKFSETETI